MKSFEELCRKEGTRKIADALGTSQRFVQLIRAGHRLCGRKVMVQLRRAFPEFSADRDIDQELESAA